MHWKHGVMVAVLAGSGVLLMAHAAEARRGGGGRPGGGRHLPRRYFLHRAVYDPFLFRGPIQYRQGDDGFDKHKENIQLKVSPKNTEVYAGGLLYSKKGSSPRFNLPSGEWKIELRAPGYESQTVELKVEPGVKYR